MSFSYEKLVKIRLTYNSVGYFEISSPKHYKLADDKMILHRPISENYISQGFGLENTAPSMLEAYRKLGLEAHNGVDYKCEDGSPLYFNCYDYEGRVIELSHDTKAGLGIVIGIQTPEGCFKTIYWHLKDIGVEIGQVVSTGQLLGHCDNTGWSTGSHLHFGLKETDNNFNTINRGNGYNGCINPTPYFTNTYIKDITDNLSGQKNILKKILKLIQDFLKDL